MRYNEITTSFDFGPKNRGFMSLVLANDDPDWRRRLEDYAADVVSLIQGLKVPTGQSTASDRP